MPSLRLVVTTSRAHPTLLSVRVDAEEDTATGFRRALVAAGFKAGDVVELMPAAEAERLREEDARMRGLEK